ncbi:MAG: hypothetical protein J6O60_08370 [Lachnospiraceae bacterium]|nr:hypothetical protein [Lachnospiraceae bacterium]
MIKAIDVIKNGLLDSKKRILSAKFWTALLLVLALSLATTPNLNRVSEQIGEGISIGIISCIFDNKHFSAFYGIIVCYLLSEIPFFNANELFTIMRMGRRKWFATKAVSMAITLFLFTCCSFVVCFMSLFPDISITNEWGKVIMTLAYSANYMGYITLICNPSPEIVGEYQPYDAIGLCFIMVWLVSLLLGLMMYAISIYWNRFAAIVIASVVCMLGLSEQLFITCGFLPYLSVCMWYRLSTYGTLIMGDIYYPELSPYVILLVIMLVTLTTASAIKIKHTEFDWISET